MAKKYFAVSQLRCGLKKVFQPGEEIPCKAELGDELVKDGQATSDEKAALRLKEEFEEAAKTSEIAREPQTAEEAIAQVEEAGGDAKVTEKPKPKAKAKPQAKKAGKK